MSEALVPAAAGAGGRHRQWSRRRLTGPALDRRVILAMIKRRAAAAGLPPSTCCHTFPGDGDHGVPVERGNPGARAADRGARVAEDDEALRPYGGHRDGRRDRAHRDLNGAPAVLSAAVRTGAGDATPLGEASGGIGTLAPAASSGRAVLGPGDPCRGAGDPLPDFISANPRPADSARPVLLKCITNE